MTNARETKEHEQNTYTDNSKSRCDATHAETSSRRKNRTWICCHANRIDTARHYRRSEHHVETDRRGHQRILPMRPNFSGQWSSSCCYCSLERRCQPLEQRRRRMIGTQREQGHGASLVVGGDRIWQGLISTIHTCTQVLLVAKSEEWALSILHPPALSDDCRALGRITLPAFFWPAGALCSQASATRALSGRPFSRSFAE